MTRSYLPDPIPREAIERIVSTVRRAPSGGFSQGHRLVVVTEPETRAGAGPPRGRGGVRRRRRPGLDLDAPVHVFVGTARRATTSATASPTSCATARRSAGRRPTGTSTRAPLHAPAARRDRRGARERRVYGVLPEQVPAVKALLGVPDDVHFVCLVTIGTPAPDPRETDAGLAAVAETRSRWTSSSAGSAGTSRASLRARQPDRASGCRDEEVPLVLERVAPVGSRGRARATSINAARPRPPAPRPRRRRRPRRAGCARARRSSR